MRKINKEHENQIDNLIYDKFVIPFTPILRNMGLTPNMISILSVVLALIGLYLLTKNNLVMFSLLYTLAYILDCVDGYMARKYDMGSKLGEFLDHGGDTLKFFSLMYILYSKYNLLGSKKALVALIFIITVNQLHMGCQEKHSNYKTEVSLELQKRACLNKDWIYTTRYFGVGTMWLVVIGISNYLVLNYNKN
jgi:phosphatidylglycerophosphate synthase